MDSGSETDYLTHYSLSSDYQNWLTKFDIKNALIQTFDFEEAIQDFCVLEKQIATVRRKDYYYNNFFSESFSEHLELYGGHCRFTQKVATEKDISEFKTKYNVVLPEDIKQFYQKFGAFQTGDLQIFSLKKLKEELESEYGDSLRSITFSHGVLTYQCFGEEDKWEGLISEEIRTALDKRYIFIGFVNLYDATNLILYADRQGKCDFIFLDDEGCDNSEKDIENMLKKNNTRFSILQLIYALLIPVSTSNFGDNYGSACTYGLTF